MKINNIKVGEQHYLYYETHGNDNGTTILFVHGGPGLASKSSDLNIFNLNKHNVILYDQRGCGKSTPKGDLNSNTTEHLINDINKIISYLNIERIYLFGGSWGSCLSLLYAIKHPENVAGLILRGLFTATKQEREHFEKGGTKIYNREAWNRYLSFVPNEHHQNPTEYYFKQILLGDLNTQEKYSYELIHYGYSVSRKKCKTTNIHDDLKNVDYLTRAKILSHYSLNNFFIPDNFIETNMYKISHIPIKLVHGIHDNLTLFSHAKRFSHKFDNVELYEITAGHSPIEKQMEKELKRIVNKFVN